MKALDFIQSLFPHQPVIRSLQVKQRNSHLSNFFSRVAVQHSPHPLCHDRRACRTDSLPNRNFQIFGCARPDDEIFEQEIRRSEPIRKRERQEPGQDTPSRRWIGNKSRAENNSYQICRMSGGKFHSERRSIRLSQEQEWAILRNQVAEPEGQIRIRKKLLRWIRSDYGFQIRGKFREEICKETSSPLQSRK